MPDMFICVSPIQGFLFVTRAGQLHVAFSRYMVLWAIKVALKMLEMH